MLHGCSKLARQKALVVAGVLLPLLLLTYCCCCCCQPTANALLLLQSGTSWSSQWQPEVCFYEASAYRQHGLASLLVRAWNKLSMDSLEELGVAGSLEELLGCQELFGRLLSLRRYSDGGAAGSVR
jgi:hypothetical protein